MKKFRVVLIILLLALAGFGTWYFAFRKKEKPIVLETVQPQVGYISRSVTATGTLQPVDTVSVGTQESGTIKNIYADFNSKVKKGQLIAELDKSLLQATANQFRANLASAKSQLIYQKSAYDRQNILFQAGAISKADYETATFNYKSAQDNVNSVQAQVSGADKNLAYANIYSPVDGVVMTRNVSIGQTVAASFNTPTLFVIAKDIAKMQVQGAIDEADIGNVKLNQRVTFTVDAYPDDVFAGTVQQIRLEPTVSANVVTYTTIISAPNDNLKLKPGMTANISVFTKEEKNALLIPAKALKFQPDETLAKQFEIGAINTDSSARHHDHQAANDTSGRKKNDTTVSIKKIRAFVWVKKEDSLVQRKIITGLNDDTNVQVLGGLTADDLVVTGVGNTAAKQGAKTAPRSPFMPARPGARPAAGGKK